MVNSTLATVRTAAAAVVEIVVVVVVVGGAGDVCGIVVVVGIPVVI